MNDTTPTYGNSGYSASVSLRLRVNGCVYPLAQVGQDRVMFDTPTILPEGDAELIVTIDGQEIRRRVNIGERAIPRCVIPVTDA